MGQEPMPTAGLGFAGNWKCPQPQAHRGDAHTVLLEFWTRAGVRYHTLNCFLVQIIVPIHGAVLTALSSRRFFSKTSVGVYGDCPSSSVWFWGDVSRRCGRASPECAASPARHAATEALPVPQYPKSALSLGKIWGQKNRFALKHWSAKINWVTERQNNAVCFRALLHLDSHFPSAIHLRQDSTAQNVLEHNRQRSFSVTWTQS